MTKTFNPEAGQAAQVIAFLLGHEKTTAKEVACLLHNTEKPSEGNISMAHKVLNKLIAEGYVSGIIESDVKYFSISEGGKEKIKAEKEAKAEAALMKEKRERLLKEGDELLAEFVAKIKMFLQKNHAAEIPFSPVEISVDYQKLNMMYPEIASVLSEEPAQFMDAAKEALKQIDECPEELPQILIVNFPKKSELADVRKVQNAGKLVSFEGMLVNISAVYPTVSSVNYECDECGQNTEEKTKNGIIMKPFQCSCGSRTFK